MKNAHALQRQFSGLALAACAALATGCATTQNTTALGQADKLYNDTAADAALMKNERAAGYMANASKLIHKAEHEQIGGSSSSADQQEINSLAYVATQNVLAAKAVMAGEASAAELAKLKADRDAALLAKQERDAAEKARLAAEQAERDRAAAALAAALAAAQAKGAEITESENALKITFRNLTFDTNKANIKPEFQATLDELADALKQRYPNADLEILGHTDSRGSDVYNEKLSEKRAIAVKTFLIGKGLAETRLSSKGLGETAPVASNDTEDGRAMNRRVELTVTGTQGQ